MDLVFMGTPEFAVPALRALAAAGHRIAGVFTQPDKPVGRGAKVTPPPVKRAAGELGLAVHQPAKIRTDEVFELLRSMAPETVVIVGYGKLIPQNILDLPRHGCINLHASLLPKYRGAAPVNWAIVRGESVTGVTTMRIDAGLDTGDILLARDTAIGPDEDAASLGQRLAAMGAPLVVETLEGLERGTITPRPQDHAQASYAPILKKEDGRLDWGLPARDIFNRVRGLVPWPGTFTTFRGQMLHVWRVRNAECGTRNGAAEPGTLVVEGLKLLAGCGEGTCLELLEVQLEGRRRIPAADFIHGARLRPGPGERMC